jgi:Trk K+ transport system NAD-binding subunit
MKIIVLGAGHVGRTLVEALHEEHDLTIIDTDAGRLEAFADAYDVRTVQGDGTTRKVVRKAGVEEADLLLGCSSREEANLVCALLTRRHSKAKTVVRTTSVELLEAWRESEIDVDFMISPEIETANAIAGIVGLPAARQTDVFADGRVQVVEFDVPDDVAGDEVIGRPLREAALPEESKVAGVIRARVQVGVHGLGDPLGAAVRDHGVDEAVAATVGDVALGEAEAQEVARVVAPVQVALGVGPGRLAGDLVVGLHHDGELGGHDGVRSDPLAREARVLRRREVRVRAERPACREVEHLGSQRGGDARVAGNRRISRVQAVEELAHLGERLRVLARRLGVADADAEQESPRERPLELRALRRDVGRLVLPDVEDPGRDRHGARALQERPDLRERRAAADPQRREAERLELGHHVRPLPVHPPDADASKVHRSQPGRPGAVASAEPGPPLTNMRGAEPLTAVGGTPRPPARGHRPRTAPPSAATPRARRSAAPGPDRRA